MKKDNKYLSIPEVAKILGISRIAVYKKVKKGDIDSIKIGNQYVISNSRISEIMGKTTSPAKQKKIELSIKKFVEEYRDLIIRLGDE
jgi:excisionase family DNA binding protein